MLSKEIEALLGIQVFLDSVENEGLQGLPDLDHKDLQETRGFKVFLDVQDPQELQVGIFLLEVYNNVPAQIDERLFAWDDYFSRKEEFEVLCSGWLEGPLCLIQKNVYMWNGVALPFAKMYT